MSVAIRCIAENINLVGPMMGSNGYVGLIPSLDVKLDFVRDSERKGGTFGWIYDALSSIGLITYEMENFKSFLQECGDHKVHLTTDHDESDLPNINMDELVQFTNIVGEDFKVCSYRISSPANGTEVEFLNSSKLDKFIPNTINVYTDAASNFIQKINEVDIWHEFFQQMGILDPIGKMEELVMFVKSNESLELIVEIKEI